MNTHPTSSRGSLASRIRVPVIPAASPMPGCRISNECRLDSSPNEHTGSPADAVFTQRPAVMSPGYNLGEAAGLDGGRPPAGGVAAVGSGRVIQGASFGPLRLSTSRVEAVH